MSEATPRKVGFATGETNLREVMFRSEFADGTCVDTEPAEVGKTHLTFSDIGKMLSAGQVPRPARPARTVRYERTVTIWVGEWAPVPEASQPEPEAAAS
jgi:hypothetical protein